MNAKIEGLTPEQQEKANACKTPEEVLALAKEIGYELSEEELDEVSGGKSWYELEPGKAPYCPNEGNPVYWQKKGDVYHCPRCNARYPRNDPRIVWK